MPLIIIMTECKHCTTIWRRGGDAWILLLKNSIDFLPFSHKFKKIINWINLYKSVIPITHDYILFVNTFILYVCFFFCMYVCVPHSCLLLIEVRRGHWITGIKITQLWAARWELGIERRSLEELSVVLSAEPPLYPDRRFLRSLSILLILLF